VVMGTSRPAMLCNSRNKAIQNPKKIAFTRS
jgi:hypothetical protein